eukprot:1180962-Amphidinium_carterae.1
MYALFGVAVIRAEFFAVVRVLEDEVVNDCKRVVNAVQVLQTGLCCKHDGEPRKGAIETLSKEFWLRSSYLANADQIDVDSRRITANALHGNGHTDALAK